MEWGGFVCDSFASPRSNFFSWLIAHQRLPTFDRLAKWGFNVVTVCRLCQVCEESHQHLILECAWSIELRRQVFPKLDDVPALERGVECKKVGRIERRKLEVAKVYTML